MANHNQSALHTYHGTLTAGDTDTVTLTEAYERVEIINRDGTAEIYYTLDSTLPTVKGANTKVTPAAITSDIRANPQAHKNLTVVTLISTGAPQYSVQGVETTVDL